MATQIEGTGWVVDFDPGNPASVSIGSKFFRVIVDQSGPYAQALIVEATDQSGIAGRVVPIVRNVSQDEYVPEWQVLVTTNRRAGDGWSEQGLVEASRWSAANSSPALPVTHEVLWAEGVKLCNSARIRGDLRFGIADVSGIDIELPTGAKWISLREFSKTTDVMGQAALFCAFAQGLI